MKTFVRNMFGAALIAVLVAATSYVAPLLAQSGSQTAFFFGETYLGTLKHWAGGSARAPALTLCGTSPVLATGSGDTAGDVTMGTVPGTSCVLTFGTAYAAAPSCFVNTGASATKPQYVASATALHFNVAIASTLYSYICIAKSGG